MSDRPELFIVGGPNGAGKTTLSRELIRERGLLYLGADEVAAQEGLGSTGADAVRAGRLFLERIDEAIRERQSVLVESTLSGLGTSRMIRRFRAVGYGIAVALVFIDSADECVMRIRGRVAQGGHHVPDEDVRRRFGRSLRNFWNRYRHEADAWWLYYNGERQLVEVARGTTDSDWVEESSLAARFSRLLEE